MDAREVSAIAEECPAYANQGNLTVGPSHAEARTCREIENNRKQKYQSKL